MPDRKFCTQCGTPNDRSATTCSRCGSNFVTGGSPPLSQKSAQLPVRDPSGGLPASRGPETLAAFTGTVLIGMIKNSRKMIKGLITGIILSFVIVLVIHTLLLLAATGAPGTGNTDLATSVLALAGLQSSPQALLFWFLLAGIVALFSASCVPTLSS